MARRRRSDDAKSAAGQLVLSRICAMRATAGIVPAAAMAFVRQMNCYFRSAPTPRTPAFESAPF